jgi:hypothetical protein
VTQYNVQVHRQSVEVMWITMLNIHRLTPTDCEMYNEFDHESIYRVIVLPKIESILPVDLRVCFGNKILLVGTGYKTYTTAISNTM